MKRKDVIILEYKVLIPKAKKDGIEEPDWESMKIDPKQVNKKIDYEVSWIKRTFEIAGTISLEDIEEGSVINHEEGTFVVNMKFKKLYKLIYKK